MGRNKSTFKNQIILLFALIAAVAISGLTSCAQAQGKDGNFLLTENGADNPEYSTYKNAPILETGGDYYATPAFDGTIVKLGENGTIDNPTPFSRGVLTNGDISSDYHRQPMPYAYWSNKQKATLDFDLKKNYYISKVRVNVRLVPKVHGISKIGVYTWDELLEAGQIPFKVLTPINGWNEFDVDKPTDKIRLEFTRQPDSRHMTVMEVEIWGHPTDRQTTKTMPVETAVKTNGAPRNYRAFDFGPAGSPVFDDFLPVDIKTVYTHARGYGWIPFYDGVPRPVKNSESTFVPGLMERDRGSAKGITKDELYRDYCGVERSYTTQITQEFAVDLKRGKYLVYLTSGDLVYGHPGEWPMAVDAEGKRVLNSIRYDKTFRAHISFPVEVTDGQLNLHFSSDQKGFHQGWRVNGLCIFPDNSGSENAAALKAIGDIENNVAQQKAASAPAPFTKVEHVETNRLFPLTKEQTNRGYLLFIRDWMKMIYPNTVPLKQEVDDTTITAAAAPGQYQPATVGIYPLKSTFDAEVKMSDLVNAHHDRIAKNNISIRITGYLSERMKNETRTVGDNTYYLPNSSWGTSYMEKVPKALFPYNGKISVNETKQIWLTFHVPENAKPGQYKGTLTFTPQGYPQQTLNVILTVYPFQLQRTDRIEGVYWSGSSYYPQNLQKELDDMAQHGIRAVVISGFAPLELKKQNGKVVVDFTRIDPLMEAIKKAGLTGYMPFSTGSTRTLISDFLEANPDVKMSADKAFTFVIAGAQRHAKEKQWPPLLFYPVDEIGNSPQLRELLKHLSSLIRAAAPDAKIYTTVNNFAAGVEYADAFDYECVNIPLPKEQEKDILKRGKVYMRYGNSYNFNPRISRTLSGFGFWRHPAEAMYYYHYQYIVGDPYNPLDGTSRDFLLSYPSPDGPINSIDFEAIRQGIDDLNYIATMQNWMSKARQKNAMPDVVKQGQAILDEINAVDPSYSQYDLIGVTDEKYHEWRSRMAQVVITLQEGLIQK